MPRSSPVPVQSIVKIDCLTSKNIKAMKKIENSFKVSGFIGKDAETRQFQNNTKATFSLAIVRNDKVGEETKRTSAFINVEAWRKNEKAQNAFSILKAKAAITVEGYFNPEEWTDKDGKKQQRVTLVATRFYETPDKEEEENPS